MARSFDYQQKLLLAAGALSMVLWALPGFGFITLPLVYLNTHIHELCHALAAAMTGGDVLRIAVHENGNGETLSAGGWPLFISSAGYVGASLIGALMIAGARTPKGAKSVLLALGCFLALGLVLWVRGTVVGLVADVCWIAVLLISSQKVSGKAVTFFAQFLGMQQALTSVLALYVLLRINLQPGIHNDALVAQESSGIPAILWALIWVAFSGLGLWAGLRSVWAPNRRA